MLSILIGLFLAVIFSFVTYEIYGLEGVMTLQWIDWAYWAIIITGFVIGAANTLWRCLPCEFGKFIHSKRFKAVFCDACK